MKTIKVKINEIPFFLAVLIMMIYRIAEVTIWNNTDVSRGIFLVSSFALLCVRFCFISKFSLRDLMLVLIGLIVYFNSKDDTILLLFSILIASRGIEEKKIITFLYQIQKSVLIICVFLYIILLLLHSPLAEIQHEAGRTRYYFMFSHPNIFSVQLLFVVLAFIYLNFERLKFYQVILCLFLTGLFIFLFPNSKSAAFTSWIIMMIFVGKQYFKQLYRHFIKWIIPVIIIFILFFIRKAIGAYSSGQIDNTVSLLSNRFDLAAIALDLYPINLFGQIIDELGQTVYWKGSWRVLWVDMAYIRLFITCGLVGGCTFLYYFIKETYYEIKNKSFLPVVMLMSVALMGTSEWVAFSILNAFPLIFIRRVLEKNKSYG